MISSLLGKRESLPPVSAPWGGRIMMLSEGENPSVSYFVRPQLAAMAAESLLIDSRRPPEDPPLSCDGVVIVRYLPACWRQPLASIRRAGKPVAFFMDDELFDRVAHRELPAPYRRKLRELAFSRRRDIEWLATEFWVSTAALASRYPLWRPKVIAPRLIDEAAASPLLKVCYHGTASHTAEHRWLREMVASLQEASERTHFTLVGDRELNRQFRGLPRVSVLHPLAWDSYQAQARAYPCDIALAPLLPTRFNACRGPTKFLDFVRLGAAGIYADAPPYRDVVRHGIDGMLLPMDPARWIDAILMLADDPVRRQRLAAAARQRALDGPLV